MAAFDPSNGTIVVRVVYDGPPAAGKTQNLRQLVQSFSSQRRSELSSPRQTGDATSYFDWLYLNGGVVAGHALRAQLVTVPGRSVLMRRRWQLVESADVIVFVCESTARGAQDARRWLELLTAHLRSSGLAPPIIVQANKQDVADALPAADVARALGLAAGAELVPASAATGEGVRDTVVRAIRAAASLAEREIIARGAERMAQAEGEAQLLARLDGSSRIASVVDAGPAGLPPLPDEDVPTSRVWPSTTGRKTLRALARGLASAPVRSMPVEGRIVLRVGDLRACADRTPRTSASAASETLRDAARRHVQLASLAPPGTTLALASGDGESMWLWSISRWTPSLRERLESADASGDEAAIASALRAYGRAIVEALVLAVRDGVGIDLDPTSFGEIDERVVYLGDRIVPSATPFSVIDAIPEVARRWSRRPAAVQAYVDALGAALEENGPLLRGVRASLALSLERAGSMPKSQPSRAS